MDNALCGGAGATLTGAALASVKAAIFMGDPHNVNGLPYNVGTCRAGGVSASPSLFVVSCLTKTLVCSSPKRLQMFARQPEYHPVILRLDRPVLL
jgi:acetylxylan esterase